VQSSKREPESKNLAAIFVLASELAQLIHLLLYRGNKIFP